MKCNPWLVAVTLCGISTAFAQVNTYPPNSNSGSGGGSGPAAASCSVPTYNVSGTTTVVFTSGGSSNQGCANLTTTGATTLALTGGSGYGPYYLYVTNTVPTASPFTYPGNTVGVCQPDASSANAVTSIELLLIGSNYYIVSCASSTASGIPAGKLYQSNYPTGPAVTATAHAISGTLLCADTSGSATAQVCSTSPTFTLATNDAILYTTTTGNTGDLTVAVNGGSAIHVRKWLGSSVLASGDLPANKPVLLVYDGTYLEIDTIGNAPSGAGTVTTTGSPAQYQLAVLSGASSITGVTVPANGTLLQGLSGSNYPTWSATPTLGIASTTSGSLGFLNASNAFTFTMAAAAAMTASNTIVGPVAVSANNALMACGVTSTTCTLTDSGIVATGGSITTGGWAGTTIPATKGGTGVSNALLNTITFTSSLYGLTVGLTAATNVTFPTSGTLVNTSVATLGSLTNIGTSLGTGILKVTTGTGALTNAAAADIYGLFTSCTGSSGLFLKDGGTCAAAGSSGLTINSTTIASGGTNAFLYGDGTLLQNDTLITRAGAGFMKFTQTALGTTPGDAVELLNSTAAANNAQQISPSLHLSGQGWKTTATAASQSVDWAIYNLPVQGAANPSTNLMFTSSINAGGYTTVFDFAYVSGSPASLSMQFNTGTAIFTNLSGNGGFNIPDANGLTMQTATGLGMCFSTGLKCGGTIYGNISPGPSAGILAVGTGAANSTAGAMEMTNVATLTVLTANLKTCTASTGVPWRAAVSDATAPTLGVALTGGGSVFALVHCSLTTGTYLVDGI